MKTKLVLTNLLTLLALAAILVFGQGGGPLVPPAPPGVTMKTIEEAEPRIPLIDGAPDTAAVTTSDPSYHFVINEAGSYYFASNLKVTKPNGIKIDSENVTIDLSGFNLSRASGGTGEGIDVIPDEAYGCIIRTGTISGFAVGIKSDQVVSGGPPAGAIYDITVSGCSLAGFDLGRYWVVTNCLAFDNFVGITAESGCRITGCAAYQNDDNGINGGESSTIINCVARGNGARGFSLGSNCSISGCAASLNGEVGIRVLGSATMFNCTASRNDIHGIQTTGSTTLTNCSGNDNLQSGILTGNGSTISNCTANSNGADGIIVANRCLVRENNCSDNSSAGLRATGTGNRIESNHLVGNDTGAEISGTENVFIKNSIQGNTSFNTAIIAGNEVGDAILIDGTWGSSAHAWGNFND